MFVVGGLAVGGIQRVNATLVNALSEYHQVCIQTLGSSKDSFYPLKVEQIKADKDSHWNFKINLLRLLGILKLEFVIKKILLKDSQNLIVSVSKRKSETVILSAENILYIPYLKEKFPHIKMIAWIHGSADIYLNRVFSAIKKDFTKGLSQADEVVCLTHEDKKEFEKYNQKTRGIYNPVTVEATNQSKLDAKIISWTGRLRQPVKGLDYLAEVASKLPEGWKISVAGGGDTESFNKYLKKFNADSKVIYRGSLTGEDLNKHYLESSIYLMTSRWEGFGLVLGEAMSFGLPIVAFEQSGSKEVLDNGKYGLLVENGNVDDMVKNLENLINDLELRKQYSEKSLQRAKDFSVVSIIKEWEEIL